MVYDIDYLQLVLSSNCLNTVRSIVAVDEAIVFSYCIALWMKLDVLVKSTAPAPLDFLLGKLYFCKRESTETRFSSVEFQFNS